MTLIHTVGLDSRQIYFQPQPFPPPSPARTASPPAGSAPSEAWAESLRSLSCPAAVRRDETCRGA